MPERPARDNTLAYRAISDERSFMRLPNRFGFSVALVLHVVPVENAFKDQQEYHQISAPKL
jgi:hypothetical protein